MEQEATGQGETGLCHLQGACVAEAVEPRLVGMKHEGKPFRSMQRCQLSGCSTRAALVGQYLLEDYSGQKFPQRPLSALCLGRLF